MHTDTLRSQHKSVVHLLSICVYPALSIDRCALRRCAHDGRQLHQGATDQGFSDSLLIASPSSFAASTRARGGRSVTLWHAEAFEIIPSQAGRM